MNNDNPRSVLRELFKRPEVESNSTRPQFALTTPGRNIVLISPGTHNLYIGYFWAAVSRTVSMNLFQVQPGRIGHQIFICVTSSLFFERTSTVQTILELRATFFLLLFFFFFRARPSIFRSILLFRDSKICTEGWNTSKNCVIFFFK